MIFMSLCSNGKGTLNKTIKKIKLNIATNTSHTSHCLLQYRSRYIPPERRHRIPRGCIQTEGEHDVLSLCE
jgi:hypothetical protein